MKPNSAMCVSPCLFFCVTVQACSGAGEWRAALSILEDAQREGLRPSGEAYIAAMAACARGGVVDLTLELLRKILAEHAGDEAVRIGRRPDRMHFDKGRENLRRHASAFALPKKRSFNYDCIDHGQRYWHKVQALLD